MNISWWHYVLCALPFLLLSAVRFPTHTNSVLPVVCESAFYIPSAHDPPCYVRPPLDYQLPFDAPKRLYAVPLGNLATSNHTLLKQTYIEALKEDTLLLREDNRDTLDTLRNITTRCGAASRPVVLDLTNDVASLAANVANNSIAVVSGVPPTYEAAIVADRGLPGFLYLGPHLPFPSRAVDAVICENCDSHLSEVYRILVPGGAFISHISTSSVALGKHNFQCNSLPSANMCIKSGRTESRCALDASTSRRARAHARAIGDQLIHAIRVIRTQAESRHSTDRVLNAYCTSALDCWRVEQLMRHAIVVHTSADTNVARHLLLTGSIALHVTYTPFPFAPRSFDVVHVGCGGANNAHRTLLDVHRILRPGGFAIVLSAICRQADRLANALQNTLFDILSDEGGVVVARSIGLGLVDGTR